MSENNGFKIGEPLDKLPVTASRRGRWEKVWEAALAADGKWIPVELANSIEIVRLQTSVGSAGQSKRMQRAGKKFQTARHGDILYIRCVDQEEAQR